ncbi:MAG: type II toxin-antitoxin system PemK/MazF family toxin [Betaproteobacteria bacterium]|nr:type II toxin-antitoxin system PemK/MazF family toxin [Betaproteobacteria bacterium]
MAFERFTVVRVPFPFTDRNAAKNRPALVLSDAASFNIPAGHSVMAMITSQGNAPWPLDCPITDLKAAGLPAPSMVRFKLFTLDHRLVRGALGALSPADEVQVRTNLDALFEGRQNTFRASKESAK